MGSQSKSLGRSRTLGSLARSPDRALFVSALAETEFLVPAEIDHPGIPVEELTQEAFRAMVEESAKAMAAATTWLPLTYQVDGRLCTPLFTEDARFDRFVGRYSDEQRRVFPVKTFEVTGREVATLLADCESLVVDPGHQDEYELTGADRAALARHCCDA